MKIRDKLNQYDTTRPFTAWLYRVSANHCWDILRRRKIRQDKETDDLETLPLEHPDPSLSIPLYNSANGDDVVAEWQSWAHALQRPLLVTDDSGALHELFPRIGHVRLGKTAPRRRRRTAMKGRRPTICWRRRNGIASGNMHRGEREIIARD